MTEENTYILMRVGSSRWKIENETVNTLKYQGYNLEHSYGLGKEHLSENFVMLMCPLSWSTRPSYSVRPCYKIRTRKPCSLGGMIA